MPNENLRVPTSAEARAYGAKGGRASGEARAKKKMLKECLEVLLERQVGTDKNGAPITGAEAMATKIFQAALSGNIKAWEIVRDTAGQKPAEHVEISQIKSEVADEIEQAITVLRGGDANDRETEGGPPAPD